MVIQELMDCWIKEVAWCQDYSAIPTNDIESHIKMLKENLGHAGENSYIVPPCYIDTARTIEMQNECYINYNFTVLGGGGLIIGNQVGISSGCTIITVDHPSNPCIGEWIDIPRRVVIEDGAWIGANVTILPGITIGKNAIVGAGSVVTKDVEAGTVVAGNPARVMRKV